MPLWTGLDLVFIQTQSFSITNGCLNPIWAAGVEPDTETVNQDSFWSCDQYTKKMNKITQRKNNTQYTQRHNSVVLLVATTEASWELKEMFVEH